jgi:hypothetical protein
MPAKRAFLSLSVALGIAVSTPVGALVYTIDNFRGNTAAGAFFSDEFLDGSPPPSAPNFASGLPAAYSVFGAFAPAAETGGKLAIDTSLGVVQTPFGVPVQSVSTTLLTTGLTQSLNFSIAGLFDLSQLPVNPVENFGVRVGDTGFGNGNGVVDLLVRMHGDLQLYIDLVERDFVSGVTTQVYSTPLAPLLALHPTADQIDLTLGHSVGATEMGAAFALFSSGSVLFSTLLPATAGNLFDGETFVRGGFIGVARVIPEPGMFVLLAVGLAGLGFARRTLAQAAPR